MRRSRNATAILKWLAIVKNGSATRTEMARHFSRMSSETRQVALQELTEAGHITSTKVKRPGKTGPSTEVVRITQKFIDDMSNNLRRL